MAWYWWLLIAFAFIVLFVLSGAWAAFNYAQVRQRHERTEEEAENDEDVAAHTDKLRQGRLWFYAMPGIEDVYITSFDGLKLHAKLLQNPAKRGVLLMMHGFRGHAVGNFSAVLQFYYKQGFALLLPDQRCYGKSEGKYTCFGVKERYDCADWAQWAVENVGGDVFVSGISMGGTTVLMAAPLLPAGVRGIIADCGFTSPWDIVNHIAHTYMHLPTFPFVTLCNMFSKMFASFGYKDYSCAQALAGCTLPILFVHGGSDRLVPPSNSKANYDAYTGEKQLIIVDEAAHGTSYLCQTERCQAVLKEFIDKHALQPAPAK